MGTTRAAPGLISVASSDLKRGPRHKMKWGEEKKTNKPKKIIRFIQGKVSLLNLTENIYLNQDSVPRNPVDERRFRGFFLIIFGALLYKEVESILLIHIGGDFNDGSLASFNLKASFKHVFRADSLSLCLPTGGRSEATGLDATETSQTYCKL